MVHIVKHGTCGRTWYIWYNMVHMVEHGTYGRTWYVEHGAYDSMVEHVAFTDTCQTTVQFR